MDHLDVASSTRGDVLERPAMIGRRWVGNVQYYEFTPATIVYDAPLDALTVARADLYTPDRSHRLSLAVVVTISEVSRERTIALDEAIVQGRALLESLIAQYRSIAAELNEDESRVFDLTGQRLR